MFGRLALARHYPQLTQAERNEHEEFCADACYRMRDRFLADELWERLGSTPSRASNSWPEREPADLPEPAVHPDRSHAEGHRPVGADHRKTFADMGVIGYETTDLDQVMAEDELVADQIDAGRHAVDEAVEAGSSPGT